MTMSDWDSTHWEGCSSEEGHHNCAIAQIERLTARVEELEAALLIKGLTNAWDYWMKNPLQPSPFTTLTLGSTAEKEEQTKPSRWSTRSQPNDITLFECFVIIAIVLLVLAAVFIA